MYSAFGTQDCTKPSIYSPLSIQTFTISSFGGSYCYRQLVAGGKPSDRGWLVKQLPKDLQAAAKSQVKLFEAACGIVSLSWRLCMYRMYCGLASVLHKKGDLLAPVLYRVDNRMCTESGLKIPAHLS